MVWLLTFSNSCNSSWLSGSPLTKHQLLSPSIMLLSSKRMTNDTGRSICSSRDFRMTFAWGCVSSKLVCCSILWREMFRILNVATRSPYLVASTSFLPDKVSNRLKQCKNRPTRYEYDGAPFTSPYDMHPSLFGIYTQPFPSFQRVNLLCEPLKFSEVLLSIQFLFAIRALHQTF